MAAIGIQHLALGIALALTSAGCSSWRPPVVVKAARTINNAETISSKDYERLREVTEEAIDHIKGCLLYTSPSPRDVEESRMPSSA